MTVQTENDRVQAALNGYFRGFNAPRLLEPGNWDAGIAEWAAALRSVVMSQDSYRIVELSCGWGCWMIPPQLCDGRRIAGIQMWANCGGNKEEGST